VEGGDGLPGRERLRWQCRRGMLELDLLLAGFLEEGYESLSPADKARFAALLSHPDQLLQGWLMGHASPTDTGLARLVEVIRRGDGGDVADGR